MSRLQPVQDFVLVEELLPEEVTASGIIIPDVVDKEAPNQGRVIECGPNCSFVKTSDVVMFRRYGFDDVEFNGKKYLLGREEFIMGTISKDD